VLKHTWVLKGWDCVNYMDWQTNTKCA